MKASEKAIKSIVWYETGGKPEKYLNAYWDKLGSVWTIGIGSTLRLDGTPVEKGDKITLEEAYQLLNRHLEVEIYPHLKFNTTQEKFDAFLSFIYNVGIDQFNRSTLLRYHMNKKGPEDITKAFMMWNKAGGKVIPGLIARRMTEAELYNTGNLVFYGYDNKRDKYYKVAGI